MFARIQSDLSWYHIKEQLTTFHQVLNKRPPAHYTTSKPPTTTTQHPSITPSNDLPNLGTNPSTRIHVNPIRARPRRHPGRNPLTRKPLRLKHPHVPRAQTRAAQQDAAAEFESAVDGCDLGRGLWSAGREPVHAVHQDGDGQTCGLHAGEDLAELVGVDAEVVEDRGLGEARVRFGGEVGWVAFGGVLAWEGDG